MIASEAEHRKEVEDDEEEAEQTNWISDIGIKIQSFLAFRSSSPIWVYEILLVSVLDLEMTQL
ncbi:hypothetical protein RchiOBHm_Chr1g0313791 [Rosa chinensis]|uniref:Uncharacterized protein n=1 Tax=Rosa chinensis TaxID=74649 RepID=A0A2P6S6Z3_ROSCH|nr:hypothetical protein RchiOBHm_Chr1g0313791 [Rosa chinensis]